MKTIELTKEQRYRLMDGLADVYASCGNFDIEIEVSDNVTVKAVGSVEADGYQEDSTGAWVETYRNAWVELTAIIFGDEEAVEYNVDMATAQAAEEYLNEAA